MRNNVIDNKTSQLTIKSNSEKYETLNKGILTGKINSEYIISDKSRIPGSFLTALSAPLPYPLSVCSQIKIQGMTKNAYGTLTFTSLDGNGYPQYSGNVNDGYSSFPATLTYGTYPTFPSTWVFYTPTYFDIISSDITTSLDPTVVTYGGYSLLSGACV